ncbi:MAG: hypothetical protein C4301_05175, partial [Thermus sp.]
MLLCPEGANTEKPTKDSPSSIVPCPQCGATRVALRSKHREESGGYRRRKLRTFRGIQEVRVKRIRCAQYGRQKRAFYPVASRREHRAASRREHRAASRREHREDCSRSRWYAISIQEHFLILARKRA